jgi:GR25 family glycosyltransferase involved in LPS biosynthesis
MKEQLDKFGIRFKRLRASDSYNIKIVNKNTEKIENNKQFHKNCDKNSVYLVQDSDITVEYIPDDRYDGLLCCGELGCALSHIRIWHDIIKHGYKCAVVLEDDVSFEDNFPQILEETLQNAPLDMDILFLSIGVNNSEYATPYFVSPDVLLRSFERLCPDNKYVVRLRNENNAFGMHAYAVTNAGAAKLIQHSKALWCPIDNHVMLLSNISKYAARKEMLCVSEVMSEIHMMGRDRTVIQNEIILGGNKQ